MKDIRSKILNHIQDNNPEYKKLLKQTDIDFVYFDETALIGAISCENKIIINELISMGVNINLLANQLTALSHAAKAGLADICLLLISHNAKIELGHTHPVLLLIENYENLDNPIDSIDTLHVLLPHTDVQKHEEIMTRIFVQDYVDLFQYIMMQSCISVSFRNQFSSELIEQFDCAPKIKTFLKSKQFYDNLVETLKDKNEVATKISKI